MASVPPGSRLEIASSEAEPTGCGCRLSRRSAGGARAAGWITRQRTRPYSSTRPVADYMSRGRLAPIVEVASQHPTHARCSRGDEAKRPLAP